MTPEQQHEAFERPPKGTRKAPRGRENGKQGGLVGDQGWELGRRLVKTYGKCVYHIYGNGNTK